ncbi:MAG: hypothetical protein ACYTEG_06005, partial [Planctomycetota bacterium]
MIRIYRVLAKVVTIYALLHPVVYLGAQWYEMRRMQDHAESILAARSDLPFDTYEARSSDGSPLLFQKLIYERVFSIRNILLTLVMALGLLGVGAIFQIAASLMV